MHKAKELLLLSHFRKNARSSLTKISRRTSIPVSTIFDKLKNYEQSIIVKHTSLLNFRSLGYDLKVHIFLAVNKDQRDTLKSHLLTHQRVNSVYRVNNGFDFLCEAVFTNLEDFDAFMTELESYPILSKQEYFILEDIARESFMSHDSSFETMKLPELLAGRTL